MARPIRRRASSTNGRCCKQAPRIEGRIDIPDTKASVLIQPAGRTWDYFHEVLLRWGGAIVILGMIAALGVAYLIIGRHPDFGRALGQKVHRFNGFERFSHWLTAISFVVLGVTGLNITFGKMLLLPVIGAGSILRRLASCEVYAQLHQLLVRGRSRPDRR